MSIGPLQLRPGRYQELARSDGGAGTSIASLLLILYVIFWAFGVCRERDRRRPTRRSGCFAPSRSTRWRPHGAIREFRLHASMMDHPHWQSSLDGRKQQHLHLAQRRGERARKYLNQISQAFQAHVAFSLFSLAPISSASPASSSSLSSCRRDFHDHPLESVLVDLLG